MAEHDQVSEDDAIRRAKEEIGEETIAKLRELSPDAREALLKALSTPQEPPPPSKPRNRGVPAADVQCDKLWSSWR